MESASERNRRTWKDPLIREKRIQGHLKTRYGNNIDREKYYFDVIAPLIWLGYTSTYMENNKLVDCSNPTVRKLIKLYGSTEDKIKYSHNISQGKGHGKNKGRPSPLKGKTYEQIYNSKEKADQRSKQTSDWMKTDKNIRKYATKISKGQTALYEEILKLYPDAVLEYPIPKSNSIGNYFLDIAVVSKKFNFEFDGFYWHNLPGQSERDAIRDKYLTDLGWKVFRCSFDIRNSEEIECELLKLKSKLNDKDITK